MAALLLVATAVVVVVTSPWSETPAEAVQNWGLPGDVMVPADYDGDGRDDKAIWRPSTATWWIQYSNGGTRTQQWGESGDIPVPADYSATDRTVYADGKADLAVWRPSTGTWWILYSAGGTASQPWGVSGDIPVAGNFGDHNGWSDGFDDGKADLVVWRPSTGTWWIKYTSPDGGDVSIPYGASGDIPVAADYDNDSITQPAVFRPSNGRWYIRERLGTTIEVRWGSAGDIPVPARYSDRQTSLAVYRPSNGRWYIWRADPNHRWVSTAYQIDVQWGGRPGDIPVPGDYNGDLVDDWAIFRPAEGGWYIRGADAPPTCGYDWSTGKVLTPGESYRTCHGDVFAFRTDGTVTITDERGRIGWSPGVAAPNGRMEFRGWDGRLVLANAAGEWVWSTPTATSAKLTLHDDGNLMIRSSTGGLIWQTDTGPNLDRAVQAFVTKQRYAVGTAPTFHVTGPASTPISFTVQKNGAPVAGGGVFQGRRTSTRGAWTGTGTAFTTGDVGDWVITATVGSAAATIRFTVVPACG
jgi:hypothetical protein